MLMGMKDTQGANKYQNFNKTISQILHYCLRNNLLHTPKFDKLNVFFI